MGQAVLKNCPVRHKQAVEKFKPFCSGRCANIDLGKWLGEGYRVPAEEEDMLDEEADASDVNGV